MHIERLLALVALAAVPFAWSPAPVQGVDGLGPRCEAAAGQATPFGWSDDVPPALAAIRAELVARGPAAVEDVLAALPGSPALRRIAPSVLGRHPGDATRAALIGLVADADERVASAAAFALGEVGGREVTGPLVETVRARRRGPRHAALNALGAIGAADAAIDVALDALASGDAEVRTSAAQLLAELRGSANQERALAGLARQMDLEQRPDGRAALHRSRSVIEARRG